MTLRYILQAGRFVLSRPGFDASDPNLPNIYKILDSNWQFSGSLISSGAIAVDNLASQMPFTVMFPTPLHFIPAGLAWLQVGNGIGATESLSLSGNISNDRMVFTSGGGPGWYGSSSGILFYQVFGV